MTIAELTSELDEYKTDKDSVWLTTEIYTKRFHKIYMDNELPNQISENDLIVMFELKPNHNPLAIYLEYESKTLKINSKLCKSTQLFSQAKIRVCKARTIRASIHDQRSLRWKFEELDAEKSGCRRTYTQVDEEHPQWWCWTVQNAAGKELNSVKICSPEPVCKKQALRQIFQLKISTGLDRFLKGAKF
jgi:hypothetical protein